MEDLMTDLPNLKIRIRLPESTIHHMMRLPETTGIDLKVLMGLEEGGEPREFFEQCVEHGQSPEEAMCRVFYWFENGSFPPVFWDWQAWQEERKEE